MRLLNPNQRLEVQNYVFLRVNRFDGRVFESRCIAAPEIIGRLAIPPVCSLAEASLGFCRKSDFIRATLVERDWPISVLNCPPTVENSGRGLQTRIRVDKRLEFSVTKANLRIHSYLFLRVNNATTRTSHTWYFRQLAIRAIGFCMATRGMATRGNDGG